MTLKVTQGHRKWRPSLRAIYHFMSMSVVTTSLLIRLTISINSDSATVTCVRRTGTEPQLIPR